VILAVRPPVERTSGQHRQGPEPLRSSCRRTFAKASDRCAIRCG